MNKKLFYSCLAITLFVLAWLLFEPWSITAGTIKIVAIITLLTFMFVFSRWKHNKDWHSSLMLGATTFCFATIATFSLDRLLMNNPMIVFLWVGFILLLLLAIVKSGERKKVV